MKSIHKPLKISISLEKYVLEPFLSNFKKGLTKKGKSGKIIYIKFTLKKRKFIKYYF